MLHNLNVNINRWVKRFLVCLKSSKKCNPQHLLTSGNPSELILVMIISVLIDMMILSYNPFAYFDAFFGNLSRVVYLKLGMYACMSVYKLVKVSYF